MLDLRQLQHNIRALTNGDDASRREAIRELRKHREEEWATAPAEATQPLVDWLKDQLAGESQHGVGRQEVVTILANLGPRAEPAVPELVELLKAGTVDRIRETAAIAVGKIGKNAKAAVGPLLDMLAHCRDTMAVHVVRALGGIGHADERVRTALVELWASPAHSQTGRVHIGVVLCKFKIKAEGLAKILTSTLVTNKDASLRQLSAEALSWCHEDELDVVPALLTAALTDQDEKVKQVAQAALARLCPSPDKCVHLCLKQLTDSSYAETALRNSGQLAVSALTKALGSKEPATREKAARILGSLGESALAAIPALTTATHDKDLDFRLAAAKSLWNISKKPELVVPVLVDLLEETRTFTSDATESRRRYLQTVIEALRRMGPPAKGAIPALTAMAKDKNRNVSESALSALKEISPPVPNARRIG
ncbi:MAG TPA: HEAT repeat domain-containing protein [Gemmataceae bacterium]|jgi:HEAT repeat protein|nr:HEAT repeat domain-containing protein [Gemmataceae bacterium]